MLVMRNVTSWVTWPNMGGWGPYITPLILVMNDFTTTEDSWVTSRERRMKIKGFVKILVLVTR
jgi:hypothetical protein